MAGSVEAAEDALAAIAALREDDPNVTIARRNVRRALGICCATGAVACVDLLLNHVSSGGRSAAAHTAHGAAAAGAAGSPAAVVSPPAPDTAVAGGDGSGDAAAGTSAAAVRDEDRADDDADGDNDDDEEEDSDSDSDDEGDALVMALHVAARSGHGACCDAIISHAVATSGLDAAGALLRARDEHGRTAEQLAADAQHDSVASLLRLRRNALCATP